MRFYLHACFSDSFYFMSLCSKCLCCWRLTYVFIFLVNKNYNWDHLRAVNTLMRKGMGHTAVSSLVSDPLDLATWSQRELLKLCNFQQVVTDRNTRIV